MRRRATSNVKLLATSSKVLKKSIGGNGKLSQSSAEPLRTMRALLKAANIMVTANSTTQMAVDEGGGEYSCVTAMRRSPSTGMRTAELLLVMIGFHLFRRSLHHVIAD